MTITAHRSLAPAEEAGSPQAMRRDAGLRAQGSWTAAGRASDVDRVQRWIHRLYWFVIACVVAAALGVVALHASEAEAAEPAAAAATRSEPRAQAKAGERGDAAALYHNYCSVCHGDQGDGQSRARGSLNPPPRDFTSAQSLSELTRERMLAAVTTGVPGTAMVGWRSQLDAGQIERVVDYVRETFMRASLAADAGRGRKIYAKSCSVCHGDRGAGSMWASANLRPAPRDFSAPQARVDLTRERMLASVAAGRPGTAMAGFATQLSREDMESVVDYIRSAFMMMNADHGISGTRAHALPTAGVAAAVAAGVATAANPHAAGGLGTAQGEGAAAGSAGSTGAAGPAAATLRADMSLPLPYGLKPDRRAGERFYKANCATCHGLKGDGQGPRAYFINPKPRNFIAAPWRQQLNRPAIFAAVTAGRLGTEMPAWDKVLTRQEIANVSEYVFSAFIAERQIAR